MSIYRSGFKLDVEAVAVFVRPSTADACPESFAAFAVADMISNYAPTSALGVVLRDMDTVAMSPSLLNIKAPKNDESKIRK